jgi:hypothetical protein
MITNEVIREINRYMQTVAIPPWKCSDCGKHCYKFLSQDCGKWIHIVKATHDFLYDCQGRAYTHKLIRAKTPKE